LKIRHLFRKLQKSVTQFLHVHQKGPAFIQPISAIQKAFKRLWLDRKPAFS